MQFHWCEKSGVLIALTQHRRSFYFHWFDFKSVIYVNEVRITASERTIFCLGQPTLFFFFIRSMKKKKKRVWADYLFQNDFSEDSLFF